MMNLKKPNIKLLRGIVNSTSCTDKKQSKLEILCNQILDSLIIGGIAGFSAYVSAGETAGFSSFGVAFGIAFLIKMKEYRKIKD